ncbi:MAG: phosphatase [Microscillaceae bacterium]|nr:phosphatase [Microscillaceae bacterium]MDW8460148.1 phosphatase [Cytophagales bacterium]
MKAVIDLGTNTFQLLIINLKGNGNFEIVYQEKQAVKLGKGGINQNVISPEAELRAWKTLQEYKEIALKYGVDKIYALGTSAIRNAENGQEFAKKIQEKLGIKVFVIDGEQEATWIYAGVKRAVQLGEQPNLIVDIGGGSTEFIIANAQQVFWQKSFEIGGLRLIEKFMYQEPMPAQNIPKLKAYLSKELKELDQAMQQHRPSILVGSSGAFTTFAAVDALHLQNKKYVPPYTEIDLPIPTFEKIYQILLPLNREQRLQIKGVTELRVDMIVVGAILVHYLIKKYPFRTIKVSNYSLKEGFIFEQLQSL